MPPWCYGKLFSMSVWGGPLSRSDCTPHYQSGEVVVVVGQGIFLICSFLDSPKSNQALCGGQKWKLSQARQDWASNYCHHEVASLEAEVKCNWDRTWAKRRICFSCVHSLFSTEYLFLTLKQLLVFCSSLDHVAPGAPVTPALAWYSRKPNLFSFSCTLFNWSKG